MNATTQVRIASQSSVRGFCIFVLKFNRIKADTTYSTTNFKVNKYQVGEGDGQLLVCGMKELLVYSYILY